VIEALVSNMQEIDLLAATERMGWVYVLSDKGQVVYVGQTVNVTQRIGAHQHGTKRDDAKKFDRAFRVEVSLGDMSALEGALIRRFNPRYCEVAPKDESRDVEMLARLDLELDPMARDAFVSRKQAKWVEVYRAKRVREWSERCRWGRKPLLSAVLWRTATRLEAKRRRAS